MRDDEVILYSLYRSRFMRLLCPGKGRGQSRPRKCRKPASVSLKTLKCRFISVLPILLPTLIVLGYGPWLLVCGRSFCRLSALFSISFLMEVLTVQQGGAGAQSFLHMVCRTDTRTITVPILLLYYLPSPEDVIITVPTAQITL